MRIKTEYIFLVFLGSVSMGLAGNSIASFDSGIDARTSGMGNAGTAVANGIYNVYSNPALLYQLKKANFSATYVMEFLDIKSYFAGYGQSISSGVGIGFGWFRTETSIEETTTSDILGEKPFTEDFFLAGVGYNARFFGPVGMTIRYRKETFNQFYLSGVGFDLGILPVATKSFNLGFTIKDIFTTKLTGKSYWSDEKIEEKIPAKLRAGIIYLATTELEISTGSIKLDTRFLLDYQEGNFFPGIEFFFGDTAGFRAGWLPAGKITFGFSFHYRGIEFDYAYLPDETIGISQRFTTTIKFL